MLQAAQSHAQLCVNNLRIGMALKIKNKKNFNIEKDK